MLRLKVVLIFSFWLQYKTYKYVQTLHLGPSQVKMAEKVFETMSD